MSERTMRASPSSMTFRILGPTIAPPASDTTFVLIHGIGTSHRYLSRLHEQLESGVSASTVYSLDLPGFGGLPKPATTPDVAGMASALAEVLDRLGVRDAVLVGHSMGAQWVVELAAERPDLARAVVAIGPVSDDRHRTLFAQSRALALDVLGEPPSVNTVVSADYIRCGPAYFLRQAGPMVSYPIEDRVADLRVPFLVLRGGNDPIAGTAWCRRLRDRARVGRMAVVPGHRHVVQFTAPRAVASAIRSFLAETAETA